VVSHEAFDADGYSLRGITTGRPSRIGVQTGKEPMGITCEEVWRDISKYVDDELDPIRRVALTQHFAVCRRCTSALEGTRNVIRL
jgi:hypothetical protein